jgi:glycosyltransferase involved in cell wall biosynthesis
MNTVSVRRPVVYLSYDSAAGALGRSQVVGYLERLSSRVQTTLISFEKEQGADRKLQTHLERLGIRWRPLRYHKRPPIFSTAVDVLQGARVLDRELRRAPSAIVHVRSYVPAQMAMMSRRAEHAPLVFDIRGFWADERVEGALWRDDGALYRVAKRRERAFFERADVIITLTHASVPVIRHWLTGRRTPIEVIPTCTNVQAYAGTRRRPSESHALWVGSIGTWYRFDLAVRFARVAGFPLTVLTRQIDEARAQADARANVGFVAPEQLPAALHEGDIGLCFYRPGLARLACSPTRFAEYLAAGMPVAVTPAIGDLEEIVEREQVGVVVREEDEAGLRVAASTLRRMASNEHTVARCRRVAAEYFDVNIGARRYGEIYRRLHR